MMTSLGALDHCFIGGYHTSVGSNLVTYRSKK